MEKQIVSLPDYDESPINGAEDEPDGIVSGMVEEQIRSLYDSVKCYLEYKYAIGKEDMSETLREQNYQASAEGINDSVRELANLGVRVPVSGANLRNLSDDEVVFELGRWVAGFVAGNEMGDLLNQVR